MKARVRIGMSLCLVISSLSLAGCAATMGMPEPPPESSAKLRYVTTDSPAFTEFWRLGQEGCPRTPRRQHIAGTGFGPFALAATSETSKLQMLGTSANPEQYIRERLIPADKPLYYELKAGIIAVEGTPGFSCTNAGVFTPKAGAQYELVYNVTYMGRECSVRVMQLTPGADGQVNRTPVRDWRAIAPARGAKGYCPTIG